MMMTFQQGYTEVQSLGQNAHMKDVALVNKQAYGKNTKESQLCSKHNFSFFVKTWLLPKFAVCDIL